MIFHSIATEAFRLLDDPIQLSVMVRDGDIVVPICFPELIPEDDTVVNPAVALVVALLRGGADSVSVLVEESSAIEPPAARILLRALLPKFRSVDARERLIIDPAVERLLKVKLSYRCK